MAQPKKPEHLKQKKTIAVRATVADHARLMEQSKKTGVPVAERALNLLLQQLNDESSIEPREA